MTFQPEDFARLLQGLVRPPALIELAALAGCLATAWVIVRLIRGREARPGSVWFGDGVIGGVLFPVLALLLVLVMRFTLQAILPIAVLHVAVPVMLSLAAIRLTARVLQLAFPHSHFMRVVERSVSWLAWVAVVLWISGVLPFILSAMDAVQWTIGASRLSLRNLLEGVLSAILVLVVTLWISSALEARLLKGAHVNLSMRKIAANAIRAVLLFVGLMFALSTAGIDLTALGVLGGALGVGIGFGLQKLASNYVSGFVILAERSVHIGDTVKVDNFEGRITDINTRYTVIRAASGRESLVPNEMLITQRVENATQADKRVALSSSVQVVYGTDLDALMPKLLAAIGAVPKVVADPKPAVQLSGFGTDGLQLTATWSIQDADAGADAVRSQVNLAVLRTLNEAGVEIAVPRRCPGSAGGKT